MSGRTLVLVVVMLLAWSQPSLGSAVPVRVAHLTAPPELAAGVPSGAGTSPDQMTRDVRLVSHRTGVDWYRLQLVADWQGASAPLLSIRGIITGRLAVYAPPDYRPEIRGPFDPSLDAAFSRRAMVYTLPSDLRAEQPIYIAFGQHGQPTPVVASIEGTSAYHAADLQFVRANTFFISLQVAMLLVVAGLWLVLRDRVYLDFIAYQALLVVYAMSQSGELYALPGGGLFAAGRIALQNCLASLVPAFAIRFLLAFANLPTSTPRLARLLGWMSWAFFAFAAGMWLPYRLSITDWVFYAHNTLLIAGTATALAATWSAWRGGNRPAGYFLLSWLPLLILLVFRAAQQMLAWAQPTWLQYGFAATMAVAALIIVAGLADRMGQVRRERDQATHLAHFDPLTGELNRRAILASLHEAWGTADQPPPAMAVLFLDIDHFKRINDRYGHAAGDDCLSAITRAARVEIGATDRVGRLGGEEFVVLLRDDRVAMAKAVAERIGKRIADTTVMTHGHAIHQTVSIGFAVRDASTRNVEDLVGRADAAQYRAKATGRNRVVEYQPGVDDGAIPAVEGSA